MGEISVRLEVTETVHVSDKYLLHFDAPKRGYKKACI
jgi:hypothetical protein